VDNPLQGLPTGLRYSRLNKRGLLFSAPVCNKLLLTTTYYYYALQIVQLRAPGDHKEKPPPFKATVGVYPTPINRVLRTSI
jgi:hypothetical protein